MKWPSGEKMTVREWFVHRLPYSDTMAFFGQRILVKRVKRGWKLP